MKCRNCILIGTVLLFCSCEGIKVLTLHNFSDSGAQITLKPGISRIDRTQLADYPDRDNRIADSLIFDLHQDSSMVITSIFTSFLAGAKIKEKDLRIHYLKIETKDTMVIANSKDEILELLDDPVYRYNRKLDKERVFLNSRNFGNIIIRD